MGLHPHSVQQCPPRFHVYLKPQNVLLLGTGVFGDELFKMRHHTVLCPKLGKPPPQKKIKNKIK